MVISEVRRLDGLSASPWKNGGGVTRVLAVEPHDAGTDNFLWRISLAEVSSSGDFSRFAGVDRIILLWSGSGLVLRTPDWKFALRLPLQPFNFRGEDAISCELIAGCTIDLNVMVRRGFAVADVQVGREAVTLAHPSQASIVLCATGSVQVNPVVTVGSVLEADEFVHIQDCQPGTIVAPSLAGSTFIVISLARL